jgi:hypothetical protein
MVTWREPEARPGGAAHAAERSKRLESAAYSAPLHSYTIKILAAREELSGC